MAHFSSLKDSILIAGGSGLLAINWASLIREKYAVYLSIHKKNFFLNSCKVIRINFNSVDEIILLLNEIKPKVLINTIALTDIEACEKNPTYAEYVNVKISENISKACSLLDVSLVHISTDQLFSGDDSFSDELLKVAPCNVYGRTKYLSERAVLKNCPNSLIIRTNFYGWGPHYRPSFSDFIINNLRAKKEIILFTDVYYSPILVNSLIDLVHDLIHKKASGVFNIVSSERLSKYEFGLKVANEFSLDSSLIKSGLIKNRVSLTRRPLDMSLSCNKISKFLNINLNSVNQDLVILNNLEKNKNIQEIRGLN